MEFYKSTTEYTCAASSLMIILNSFYPDVSLSKENEFRIWKYSVNLPTRASSIFGLAAFAAKQGVKPELYVGDYIYDYPDYRFKGYKKTEIDAAQFMSEQNRKLAEKEGIKIFEQEISFNTVISWLNEGKVLMARVNAGVFRNTASVSKYLVFVKENNNFIVFDPETQVYLVEADEIRESMETLHTKKKRDFRVLVFSK